MVAGAGTLSQKSNDTVIGAKAQRQNGTEAKRHRGIEQ